MNTIHFSRRGTMDRNTLSRIGVLLLVVFATVSIWAQSDTARINGTVYDASGAAIPNATVTVTNPSTGQTISVQTREDGTYSVTPLRVGTYTIDFTAKGFSKAERTDVVLQVNDVQKIDAHLKVGATQAVEVTAGAPLIQTETSLVGDVIDEKAVTNLPLNGRNFTQLVTLSPGVNRGSPGSNADGSQGNVETFRQGENGSAAISSNGLREQNNNFLLDGIDNNESIVNTIVFFPAVENTQEYRVITANAPAEFGRGGGAIINVVTKSGTNNWHGSAFEFIRNSALDAQVDNLNPVTPGTTPPKKPLFQRNQFGGSFGGPIIKDKTFFFVDYQGQREQLPIESGQYVTVPTAKMRTGDFSELLNPAMTTIPGDPNDSIGNTVQIYSPVTNTPYAGNIITDPLNPAGQAYLNAFPLPTVTTRILHNYLEHRSRRQTFNDGDVRLDHRINDTNNLFGRFSIAHDIQVDNGRIPGYESGFGAGVNDVIAKSIAVGYNHIFSPAVANEFRFGWVKQNIDFLPTNFGKDQTTALGIGGQAGLSPAERAGIVLIGGGNGTYIEYLGDGGPYRLNERTFQFSDTMTKVMDRHTIKFGGSFIDRNIGSVQSGLGKGFYFFNDGINFGGAPASGRANYEVADMLVGRTSFTTSALVTPTNAISYEQGYFLQDDYKATSRLTLNLGMRYEIFTPPYEQHDHMANYDPFANCGGTAPGCLVTPATNHHRSLVQTPKDDIGPRIGAAYDITGQGKTVLRGAYGVFYALDRGGIANQLTQNPPFNEEQFQFEFGPVTPAGIADGGQLQLSDVIPAPAIATANNRLPRRTTSLSALPSAMFPSALRTLASSSTASESSRRSPRTPH